MAWHGPVPPNLAKFPPSWPGGLVEVARLPLLCSVLPAGLHLRTHAWVLQAQLWLKAAGWDPRWTNGWTSRGKWEDWAASVGTFWSSSPPPPFPVPRFHFSHPSVPPRPPPGWLETSLCHALELWGTPKDSPRAHAEDSRLIFMDPARPGCHQHPKAPFQGPGPAAPTRLGRGGPQRLAGLRRSSPLKRRFRPPHILKADC